MVASFGHNMTPSQGREHMQHEYYAETSRQPENQGIFNKFFGVDIMSAQEFNSSGDTISTRIKTPPQNNNIHTYDEDEEYDRGLRQHRPPHRSPLSGAKHRPIRPRR
jgi:hypothetical protein